MTDLVEFARAYLWSLLAFALFGLCHSVTAHEAFKDRLAGWTSRFFVDHFWRLIYCALSLWALYGVIAGLHWMRNPRHDVWLFDYPQPLWAVITLMHLASIAILYLAFLQSDYLEFLGLRQAWRGLRAVVGRRPPAPLSLFGTHRLETQGVYAWVRHPMLAGGLLFLLTSGPSLNNMVYTGMYLSYMLIGGYYEERRMLRLFGDDYRRYQAQVGAYLPRLKLQQILGKST